ncbi:MAG: hypothetical protein A3B23_00520 [Candidatus Colwellbacteria bacterium RIFCSPLOWO2_01_FULL_48_10]|uniref:RNase H type-1 domain-containing protein n=1 Tax=Candidatus Colwellbacteria bacterium RIFCSPLOWO2_01_FULL_48_10 TaxID=1797690 RepID=A0A1G1Z3F0_9BACT|nr:MAG: hypothetical protein A3B23_00520 [Candidatus Colwellbacteria bacterium RIFCSPLOWO2_01_FULL_48_10]
MLNIYFDGACWPNPGGSAACGWVIKKDSEVLSRGGILIGTGEGMTNNVAEYHGLIEGIKNISNLGLKEREIKIYGDSNLVCNMIAKKWGWKKGKYLPHKDKPHLKVLLDEALLLLSKYKYEVQWIRRELNSEADEQSTKPLIEAGIREPINKYKTPANTDESCPRCHKGMVEKKGEFGRFYGCSDYPKCRGTKSIKSRID